MDGQIKMADKMDSGVDLVPSQSIPRFYFSTRDPKFKTSRSLNQTLDEVRFLFGVSADAPHGAPLGKRCLWPVMDCCGIPRYCSFAVFAKIRENNDVESIMYHEFERWWVAVNQEPLDEFSLVYRIIQSDRTEKWITARDFQISIEEVVQRHPGLEFLSGLPVFQARYVDTVIVRIFHNKVGGVQDKMTLPEFRKHSFLSSFWRLQHEGDINISRDIFSYKHFYVLYCRFWELDGDHDMVIQGHDLYKYDRHALTMLAIDRVLSGACRKLGQGPRTIRGRLEYKDFVWFMLCVEDKRSASGIEYWFRCLDLDGDGVLSGYEIERFYDEQYRRMVNYGISEPWKLRDFLCSLFDLVRPKNPAHITLSDLKRCTNISLFFDMIFDYRKYENYVRRIEPAFREADDLWVDENGVKVKLEGWNKFAERAYDILAQEESNQHAAQAAAATAAATRAAERQAELNRRGRRRGADDGDSDDTIMAMDRRTMSDFDAEGEDDDDEDDEIDGEDAAGWDRLADAARTAQWESWGNAVLSTDGNSVRAAGLAGASGANRGGGPASSGVAKPHWDQLDSGGSTVAAGPQGEAVCTDEKCIGRECNGAGVAEPDIQTRNVGRFAGEVNAIGGVLKVELLDGPVEVGYIRPQLDDGSHGRSMTPNNQPFDVTLDTRESTRVAECEEDVLMGEPSAEHQNGDGAGPLRWRLDVSRISQRFK
ncbi:hypothetical protein DFJ73DRAFT_340448 [Zopfochytrium polystomum]|nr:hypothetical protein DFJ73DRAFT_340448 [Zopfochytrium polystomum]